MNRGRIFTTVTFRGFRAGWITLFTRLTAIPLLIDISVSIATTKIPMIAKSGIWAMLHEARVDFSMLLGLLFLSISGAGTLCWTRADRDELRNAKVWH